MTKALTQERLKEVLDYDPETGVFTWARPSKYTPQLKGKEAGYLWRGYVIIGIDGIQYRAHHLAWLWTHGVWPDQLDHINHVKSDNRVSNLRECPQRVNNQNASMRKDNTSGQTGVCWDSTHKKWKAQIHANGRYISLGYHRNKGEAVRARKAAELQYGFHVNHGRQPPTERG